MGKFRKFIGLLIYLLVGIIMLYFYIKEGYRAAIVAFNFYVIITYMILKQYEFQVKYVYRIRGRFVSCKFTRQPHNFSVQNNVKFFHPKHINIGDNCDILEGAVIAPLCEYHGKKYTSKIEIGNNVHIGAYNRIASMQSVIIEDDVLCAAFVHITDHSHEYREIGVPISHQSVFSKGPVTIKKGVWLAFGCHILSGVTVGEYSVVAANSVVTKDVPPYTVVAGNPARIVSQYNFETDEWQKRI